MAKRFAVSIGNWNEYQERPDRANYTWFKLHQKLITGEFWASSKLEHKVMFIALLCLRNKQEDDVIHVQDFVLAGHCGIKPGEVSDIIDGLIGFGVIRDESRQIPGNTPANRGQFPSLELELELEKEREKKDPAAAPPVFITAPQLLGEYSQKAMNLFSTVPLDTQESWLAAYPDPAWIKQEINKAAAWVSANPRKAPKKFPQFMHNWLSRGWEQFRKSLPSNPSSGAEPDWVKKAKAEEAAARTKNAV